MMLPSLSTNQPIRFNEQGLIPAIVQAAGDGQVLMMAWMNQEALDRTLTTGQAHFWSRSRQTLWRKGETSGHTMRVISIDLDCDSDTLLLRVDEAGPACHTSNRTCFFTRLSTSPDEYLPTPEDFNLENLFRLLLDRRTKPQPGSYTSQLLSRGEDEIVKKIGEEAIEIILAAQGQGDQRLIEEIADLTYHTLVLLVARGLTPGDVLDELARRHAG